MSANADDSKIYSAYTPSLLHLSAVKVGVLLLKDWDYTTLIHAWKRIQLGESIPLHKHCEDHSLIKCKRSRKRKRFEYREDPPMLKCYRAQEKLLLIPPHLRKNVMEAINGLECGAQRWKYQLSFFLKLEDGECTYHWRSDGTIDEIKTVQHLVVNTNINIRKRFDLACMYCLEDSIKTLWVEMQTSGQRQFWASFNLMVFWKRRMRNGSRVPWARAALAYLGGFPEFSMPRYSSLFSFLLPKERKKFLEALNYAEDDDLRVCAHAMTKEEEEHMLLNNWWYPVKLLRSYLDWPLRSLFIQLTGKMWNYIDHYSFFELLRCIFWKPFDENFDYWELFENFWESSPNNLKEKVRENPCMSKYIESWFKEIRSEKTAHFEEQRKKRQC